MPELPDLEIYLERITALTGDSRLERLRIASPFVLRSVSPTPADLTGRRLQQTGRLGKRLVLSFEGDLHTVMHMMLAGRLHWRPPGAPLPRRHALAAWDFESGTLLLTEASTRKRASLHLVSGAAALAAFDPGGLDPLTATVDELAAALQRENHTLKRALTDPRILSGIGNTYSDEILFAARLAPVTWTTRLSREAIAELHAACRTVLTHWTDTLRREAGEGFLDRVTAFREGMAVHGRYGKPCPRCGAPVQRIRVQQEANYCAPCQTGGKLLADRGLSRLLGKDWPRSLEALEELVATRRAPDHTPRRKV